MKVKLNGNDFFDVSTQFGVTDSWHKTAHKGIDLVMNSGTKLFSPTDGIVSKVVDYGHENIGKGLIIKTDSGQSLIMGHLSDVNVKVGQSIHEGDFIALSGNTGHSSGAHLHLGLQNNNGDFVNPQSMIDGATQNDGMFSGVTSFMDFVKDIRSDGLFHAIYGKSFFEVMKDFIFQLANEIYTFIISNGDLFFICPAIIIMFATFIIGRNKYTKFIIPLWFTYFVTVVLNAIRCMSPE